MVVNVFESLLLCCYGVTQKGGFQAIALPLLLCLSPCYCVAMVLLGLSGWLL